MITPFQILTFCIYCCAIVLAIYFGSSIAEDGILSFVKILGVMGGLAWLGFGSRIWWLPLFFGLAMGGEFYFGFKILTHEAGILAGVAALLPSAILLRRPGFPHRQGLPVLVWIFMGYLAGHFLWSVHQYAHADLISIGSVGRYYFTAGWPLLFLVLFYYYGSSRHLIWGLYALEIAYFLRIASGILFMIVPSFAYLPGVNFVFPGVGQEGSDLRWSGLGMGGIALALLFDKKWLPLKPVHFLMLLLAITAVLLGGGRGALVSFLAVLLFAAIYSRNWFLSLGLPILLAGVVLAVNRNPALIDSLPIPVRRAASIVIVKELSSVAQHEAEASNAYHRKLTTLGWQRWTAGPRSFLVGTGEQPYDWSIMKESNHDEFWELTIIKAADSGNYEVGLWKIVTVMGLTALLLYLALLALLWKRVAAHSGIAKRDRFGRVFSFLAYALPFQWLCIFTIAGDFPSYELLMTGLAFIYLQDRAWEEAERHRKPPPAPVIPLPA